MKEKIKRILSMEITCGIPFAILLIFMPLHLGLLWYDQLSSYGLEYYPTMIYIFLPIMCFEILWDNVKHRDNKVTVASLILIGLIIGAVVSTALARNVQLAVVGETTRHEGLFAILGYYLLFLTGTHVKEVKEKKILIGMFVAVAFVTAITGILFGYQVFPILNYWKSVAALPFGQTNFYSSMICMCTALGMGLFLYGKERWHQVVGVILAVCCYGGTFSTNCSAPILGTVVLFVVIFVWELIIFIRKRNLERVKKLGIRLLILLVLFLAVMAFFDATRNHCVRNELKADKEFSKQGVLGDRMFNSRMGIWKIALAQFGTYWLHGVGIENFRSISNAEGVPAAWHMFDKAHNEYIQILCTQGIFVELLYLALLILVVSCGFRCWYNHERTNSQITIILFLMVGVYIEQAFFNISSVGVAPYFWLVMGLMYDRNHAIAIKWNWKCKEKH